MGLAAVGVAALAVFWLLTAARPWSAAAPKVTYQGDPERGRRVFIASDCSSCHASPGQDDRLRLGGGLALASPYGTFRAPNISSDPVDGIGRWSDTEFADAVLSGVSPASTHYYPAFPYSSYARMQPGDVMDLRAYLRTLPAVSGRPPPHELAFPFSIRRFIGLWKLLYLHRGPEPVDPTRSAAWNRGRYIVDTMAHCAECHSSRNMPGAIKERTRFAGGRDSEGTGFVPNITPVGIGRWSEADIVRMLEDGHTPDLRVVGSSMADVVANTSQLPAADRQAIAVYIKSLPPRPTPPP